MSHALRYYKEFEQPNGVTIRLEIHRKMNGDVIWVSKEIGRVVQDLHLDIQGGADTVDAPIVKTSLTMTFVDAPDLEGETKKCGDWEEFYTSDSTMWKVILKAKNEGEEYRTIWGGYVTPDSYSEELRYRGSVTIIARDNIGHMQDFPFDAKGNDDGMISLRELIATAWSKIESPMELYWDSGQWMRTDEDTIAYNTRMNVSAFEDMNWYDAVEKALYAYGAVMRYVGGNEVVVCSMRYMPLQGRGAIDKINHIVPEFIAHAQRELTPAARRIEESVKYDIESSVPLTPIKENDFTGEASTYRCKIDGIDLGYGKFGTLEHDAPVWPIFNNDHWGNVPSMTMAFNPKGYEIGYFSERQGLSDDIYRYMYLAANNVDDRHITFFQTINASSFGLRIKFTDPISLNKSYAIERCGTFYLKKFKYVITFEQDGVNYYYAKDGSWKVDYQTLVEEYDGTQPSYDFFKTINLGEYSGEVEINIIIVGIEYVQTTNGLNKYGLYAGIQVFAFEQTDAVLETNNVNTKYIDTNNVIISRDPELGPAYNTVSLPQIIKNGIFIKSGNIYLPAKKWAWSGGTPQQMAVYNHLQLLCYHSKPNNVISGDITNADFVDMAAIYRWGDANHLLVSGSYNFLNGRVENAVLREFEQYDLMWGDVDDLPDTEQSDKVQIGGGSSSNGGSTSGGGSTGGGGTSGGSGITITDVADYLEQQGYATEQWVTNQGYATKSALKSLSDKVDSIENNSVDLTGYATEQWVTDQDYATNAALKSLSDKVDSIQNAGVDLTGYATEQWVKDQGYITSSSLDETFTAIDSRLAALEKLLEWFEFDENEKMIKAKFGIYSVGAITAGKKKEE